MRTIYCLLAASTLLAPLRAQTSVGGNILTDTTWDLAGSPYEVGSAIEVGGGATLTIEAGVEVHFITGSELSVGRLSWGPGTLVGRGSAAEPILFTSPGGSAGSWDRILLADLAVDAQLDAGGSYVSGSVLEHCIVEFGGGIAETLGALQLESCSPYIANCEFRRNSRRGLSARMLDGVAGATPPLVLRDCEFRENGEGGAHITDGGSHEVSGCEFRENVANLPSSGAGMWISEAPDSRIEDCVFVGNSAIHGGGLRMKYCDSATIRGCLFEDNIAAGRGGAMGASFADGLLIIDCEALGNTAFRGGGIYVAESASLRVERTTLTSNHINDFGNDGGGMLLIGCPDATLVDSTFSGNSANTWGGGAHIHTSDNVVLDNCTFSGNDCAFNGGGLYAGRPIRITECLFDANTAGIRGGGYAGGGGASAVTTITRSTFQCNSAARGGGIFAWGASMLVLDGDQQLGHFNTFQGNSANYGEAIFNDSGNVIGADHICWGALIPDANPNRIWDQVDDSALALVLTTNPAACSPIGCGCGATTYCVSSPNSVGSGARIGFSGSTSLAANDLVLQVSECPAATPGLFFYGLAQVQIPFGNGLRCVGGSLHRMSVVLTNALGSASAPVDYASLSGASQIQAGSTRNFQFWYRDPAAGGSFFNLSDGLKAEFCE